jgi:hypothetical protein
MALTRTDHARCYQNREAEAKVVEYLLHSLADEPGV